MTIRLVQGYEYYLNVANKIDRGRHQSSNVKHLRSELLWKFAAALKSQVAAIPKDGSLFNIEIEVEMQLAKEPEPKPRVGGTLKDLEARLANK